LISEAGFKIIVAAMIIGLGTLGTSAHAADADQLRQIQQTGYLVRLSVYTLVDSSNLIELPGEAIDVDAEGETSPRL
jgi:hypothetical protein